MEKEMKALFVYMPVVHAGILSYLSEHPTLPVVLLDAVKAQSVNKFLERDIRALTATQVQTELIAHGVTDVRIVDQDTVAEQLSSFSSVLIPEDEVISDFLERFAPEVPTETISLFLRWTKQISTTENEVPAHRTISEEVFATELLDMLDQEAQKSPDWWRQIAAALVRDTEVLVTAINEHMPSQHALTINGDPRSNLDAGEGPLVYTSIHAEASTLAQAAREGIATAGASAYVTTFPCPNCARLLVKAGIARVYYRQGYSLLDAEAILGDAGIEIVLVQ